MHAVADVLPRAVDTAAADEFSPTLLSASAVADPPGSPDAASLSETLKSSGGRFEKPFGRLGDAFLEGLLSSLPGGRPSGAMNRRFASWQKCDQPLPACRRWHRLPLKGQLVLTPLDDATEKPCGTPMTVEGRDISFSGIAFSHAHPIPYAKVALSLQGPGERDNTFYVRLVWCRFTRAGVYQSGGRFLRSGGA